MSAAVNEMSTREAAKYYASIGIVTHPLNGCQAECSSPGKQPILKDWQKIEKPFKDIEMDRLFKEDNNIGYVCGACSNLTVIDVDWPRKGIWEYVFLNVDMSRFIKVSHTEGKCHFLFQHCKELNAGNYKVLGFDILSDGPVTKGGASYIAGDNCVCAPSIHRDGNKYQIDGNIEDRIKMPDGIIARLNDLINKYNEITKKILPKCRPWFRKLWKSLFELTEDGLYHQTDIFYGDMERRTRLLNFCAELQANGADDGHLQVICMVIFGDKYSAETTKKELVYIKPVPAKTESILADPYFKRFYSDSDRTRPSANKAERLNREKQGSKKEEGKEEKGKVKAKRIVVHFDEVADCILKDAHIFTMRDTGEIYLYSNGVYESEGANPYLDTEIRRTHKLLFSEKWMEKNPEIDFPEYIPKATKRFVAEVLAYIQAYTYIPRESLVAVNAEYLNFQNRLFNLNTWQPEEHTPEIRTISQISVEYDPEAKCPMITKFLNDVAKPEDIPFLLEWAGYCLTPWVMHQKSLMVYGIPGTGKSVFLALLEALVGENNCSAESLQKIEEDKYRCANLYGKRVNICSDIPGSTMHKTEVFKKLTSGIDTIDAEKKYLPSFKFKNTAKLTFSANKLPEGPKDPAFYERFCLIEFPNKFRGTSKDDKSLIRKLTEPEELSGFLNLALTGLKRLMENGCFSYNKTFEETEKEYLLNSNPVAYFMETRTVTSSEDIDSTVLYAHFTNWCVSHNMQKIAKNVFGKALSKLGYKSYRENEPGQNGRKKSTFYENVALKTVEIGQDKDRIEKNILSTDSDSEKLEDRQDNLPVVVCISPHKSQLFEEINMGDAGGMQVEESEIPCFSAKMKKTETIKDLSCPNHRFFDSVTCGQDVLSSSGFILSSEEKFPDFESNQSNEFLIELNFLKSELKIFQSTWLHKNGSIGNISTFCEAFINANPGFLQKFSEDIIIFEAEKICKKIPSARKKTTVVNVNDGDDYDVYIGRGYKRKSDHKWISQSKWHNPYHIGKDGTRSEVIEKYIDYFWKKPDLIESIPELKGKILGCHCKPDACHGEYLAKLAENQDYLLAELNKHKKVSVQEDTREVGSMA